MAEIMAKKQAKPARMSTIQPRMLYLFDRDHGNPEGLDSGQTLRQWGRGSNGMGARPWQARIVWGTVGFRV